MKLKEIYELLNKISPFELQESWDNSGLQIGCLDDEVKEIYVSLDLDEELLEKVNENSLIITHHPLIFAGIKSIDFDTFPSNFIKTMIRKNISCIAMHTNFDITHLNEYVAKEILGYEVFYKDGFVIYMQIDTDFDELVKKVSNDFALKNLRTIKSKKHIKTLALCTGSGAGMLKEIKADCYLTGDIKYHDAMLAKALKISMIDIGHFESEKFFSDILAKELKNLGIKAIISQSVNPFTYY
jgi:dinuclear metal center YbgI/SA1388 family protein